MSAIAYVAVGEREYRDCVIPDGGTEPVTGVNVPGGKSLAGVIVPAAFDGATIQFNGSRDGITYDLVRDMNGDELEVTIGGSGFYPLPSEFFWMCQYLKPLTGIQSGDSTLVLVLV
jgi:hypothetical protein